MANWYCSHTKWSAVTVWAANTAYSIGDLRRQTAAFGTLTAGNERVFRCTTAGTSHATTEPTWNLTKGATTTDNTVTWTEVTGNETYMFNGGGTWTAPHARYDKAVSSGWPAAGDTVFVGSDHTADTRAAALTIAHVGTKTAPLRVLCVTPQTSAPVQADITTGAAVITTGNNAMTVTGSFKAYGISYQSGTGANTVQFTLQTTPADLIELEQCTISLPATSGGFLLVGGAAAVFSSPANVRLLNSTINFGSATHYLLVRAIDFKWYGGSLTGTVPTALLQNGAVVVEGAIDIRDVDLNSAGTWTSKFIANLTNLACPLPTKIANCKLATSIGALTTGTLPSYGCDPLDIVVTDSTANVTAREEHYQYQGSMVQDTTNYRNGGASDGTTNKSWKVVTLSTIKYEFPFECPDIHVFVGSTGSKTITMYIGSGGTLKDNDVGFQLEYLGASGSPLGTITNTLPGILATGSNITTDAGSTWNGSSATTLQKVQKTVTINQAGVIRVRPIVMKASATVYIDPAIDVA